MDYPNNEDQCISIYMLGCDIGCMGCINKSLADITIENDNKITISVIKLIELLKIKSKNTKSNKICLLGGDPLFNKNIDFTRELLISTNNLFDFCVYTGYDIDYVVKNDISGFKFIKTGKYIEELKQESLKTDDFIQFASKNQHLYDSQFNLLSKEGKYYFN